MPESSTPEACQDTLVRVAFYTWPACAKALDRHAWQLFGPCRSSRSVHIALQHHIRLSSCSFSHKASKHSSKDTGKAPKSQRGVDKVGHAHANLRTFIEIELFADLLNATSLGLKHLAHCSVDVFCCALDNKIEHDDSVFCDTPCSLIEAG